MTTALQRAQAESFGHLLFTAARLLDERAQARLNAAAGERVARPALVRLLPFLDQTGIRPTELARRWMSPSKPSASHWPNSSGAVSSNTFPIRDGRARLVRLSAGVVARSEGSGFWRRPARTRPHRRSPKAGCGGGGLRAIIDALHDDG
jgi:hypothetical protein